MTTTTDKLYRINDVLTALAYELGLNDDDDTGALDDTLQTLTLVVAEAFGVTT